MRHCRPPSPADEVHERFLNFLRNMGAHKELAIAAAMDHCAEENICPPPWLVRASAQLMQELLKHEKTSRRGRAAGHIARYRQAAWDIERWDAVREIRRIRERVNADERIIKAYPGEFAEYQEHHERMRAWLRHGTFACASMYLAGKNSRAGSDAMRASYRRVERALSNPATASRYYFIDDRFLQKLGLQGAFDRKPGTKCSPLYDLTP